MARAREAEWAKRVERWRDSGLSAREFAGKVGVNERTLQYWAWRLGKRSEKSSSTRSPSRASSERGEIQFVEVSSPPVAPSALSGFEIVLAGGATIRVAPQFDADALRRVIAAVEGRS